jgi:hypothetical protein
MNFFRKKKKLSKLSNAEFSNLVSSPIILPKITNAKAASLTTKERKERLNAKGPSMNAMLLPQENRKELLTALIPKGYDFKVKPTGDLKLVDIIFKEYGYLELSAVPKFEALCKATCKGTINRKVKLADIIYKDINTVTNIGFVTAEIDTSNSGISFANTTKNRDYKDRMLLVTENSNSSKKNQIGFYYPQKNVCDKIIIVRYEPPILKKTDDKKIFKDTTENPLGFFVQTKSTWSVASTYDNARNNIFKGEYYFPDEYDYSMFDYYANTYENSLPKSNKSSQVSSSLSSSSKSLQKSNKSSHVSSSLSSSSKSSKSSRSDNTNRIVSKRRLSKRRLSTIAQSNNENGNNNINTKKNTNILTNSSPTPPMTPNTSTAFNFNPFGNSPPPLPPPRKQPPLPPRIPPPLPLRIPPLPEQSYEDWLKTQQNSKSSSKSGSKSSSKSSSKSGSKSGRKSGSKKYIFVPPPPEQPYEEWFKNQDTIKVEPLSQNQVTMSSQNKSRASSQSISRSKVSSQNKSRSKKKSSQNQKVVPMGGIFSNIKNQKAVLKPVENRNTQKSLKPSTPSRGFIGNITQGVKLKPVVTNQNTQKPPKLGIFSSNPGINEILARRKHLEPNTNDENTDDEEWDK